MCAVLDISIDNLQKMKATSARFTFIFLQYPIQLVNALSSIVTKTFTLQGR